MPNIITSRKLSKKSHKTNCQKTKKVSVNNYRKTIKILERLEYLIIMLIRMYIDIKYNVIYKKKGKNTEQNNVNNNANNNANNNICKYLLERFDVIKKIETDTKEITKEITIDNKKLENFARDISEILPQISNEIINRPIIFNKKNKQLGGFYFRSLEDKGDKPITGADLTTLLDEIQQFFYNAKYTEEGGEFRDTDTLISLFRGDTETFKFWLRYYIAPKYYMLYPPFLKFGAIKQALANKKYEDYPDYLLAYKSYTDSQNQYLIDQGIATPATVRSKFFDNFATVSDQFMTKLAQVRRKDPRRAIF